MTKIAIVDLSTVKTDPTVRRRELCVARLIDQQKLLSDANYTRIITRWSGKGAERKSTEKHLPVRPWWSGVKDGVALRLRFVAGRQGIMVGSMEELSGAIDQLVEQVRSGELDAMIMPVKKEKKVKPIDVKAKPISTPKGGALSMLRKKSA
jgi:hypothetical protein